MSSARVDLPTSSAGLLPPPIRCRVRSRCDAGKGSDETGGAVETAECFVAFGGHLSQSFFFLSVSLSPICIHVSAYVR